MIVKKDQLRLLRPYLEGEGPTRLNKRGEHEWDMHCPLHEDNTRSVSLNVDTAEWWCFKGCGGGTVAELIRRRDEWLPPPDGSVSTNGGTVAPAENINQGMIDGWQSNLMSNERRLEWLVDTRGLSERTIERFGVGWDTSRQVYTIPVYGPDDVIWNVRRYDPEPAPGKRKIWGVKGMNEPRLYPWWALDGPPGRIILGGGEWDIMVTHQNGFNAITRTADEAVWKGEWSELFAGWEVFMCHDMDSKGQTANRKHGNTLHRIASVYLLGLPYPVADKHGPDLSDYWLDGHQPEDMEELMARAPRYHDDLPAETEDPRPVTVLESFDATNVGQPVDLVVTIKGKKEPGYTVPHKAHLTCTRDKGPVCNVCPLNAASGDAVHEIKKSDPLILGMLESAAGAVADMVRQSYGVPVKCNKLHIDVQEHQSVEVLFARPAIDYSDGARAEDYKNIKITHVGAHDTMANNTVKITGALYPNPRSQGNEFQAWELQRMETSVDRFDVTPQAIVLMKKFQANRRQRPLRKAIEIARELSTHVTRIVGRTEMHVLMDLTFHSALAFYFGGQLVHRGWIETLIAGDTRTGKSDAATALIRHYGAGEIISCESASLAGILGGLQQFGGKEWAITWGVIPLNDRRLVVLDEVSGMTPEDISQLSEVRSSGVAKIHKIQSEVSYARTRLLWLSNPRFGGMDQYTYGVDAIRPIIGNPEDIARFDLAMTLTVNDVAAEKYNRPVEGGTLLYPSEACHTLLMWVWTRQPDQIRWAEGAEDVVYAAAGELGERYVPEPPLVQAANIRIKIARVAVALAGRLFSTDESGQLIIVRPEHVHDAVTFLQHLYDMDGFGYGERSRETLAARKEAYANFNEVRAYLKHNMTLARFLRSQSRFRRQDLEEVLNVDRDGANAIINRLWEARMVRKDQGDVRVEPPLHELLREVR